MVVPGTSFLASLLVLLVPSVVAATAITLSRSCLFTVEETTSTPFGEDRYEYTSRNHRRAFGVLVEFFLLATLVGFAVEAYLVGA